MATAEATPTTTTASPRAEGGPIQCVVVTPERTVLDEAVAFVAVPVYDGELGLLPGHTPVIARLGFGALRIRVSGGAEREFFVDGGFAQFRDDVLSVLTQRSIPVAEIDGPAAEKELDEAKARVARSPEDQAAKAAAIDRARALVRLASNRS
jgi:F-type H+-transporting ATPase subunit epsilon